MGRSLLITGAIMGSDVRLVTPAELRPPQDVIELAHELAADSGLASRSPMTSPASPAPTSSTPTSWVSMGEAKEVWTERTKLLAPFQVNAELLAATNNPKVKFMHCLPAFHNAETTVGSQSPPQPA